MLYPRGGFAGLRPHALQVLAALARAELRSEQRSSIDLASLLNLDRSTVRHALGQLRERGLVKETMDGQDRRLRLQQITERGRVLVERLSQSAERRRT